MSVHTANINWQRHPHSSDSNTYSRNHLVKLNGDQQINVSASKEFKGDPNCADPEQMLLSAVSSCHMLFFLAVADFKGFSVESYDDNPEGYLEKNAKGGMEITRITLNPKVIFSDDNQPDSDTITQIHAKAHKSCFIRNSITASVEVNHF